MGFLILACSAARTSEKMLKNSLPSTTAPLTACHSVWKGFNHADGNYDNDMLTFCQTPWTSKHVLIKDE